MPSGEFDGSDRDDFFQGLICQKNGGPQSAVSVVTLAHQSLKEIVTVRAIKVAGQHATVLEICG